MNRILTVIFNKYRIFCILSVIFYALSFTQEAFCTEDGGCADSSAILISGIIGVFLDENLIAWFANPLFLVSLFLIFIKKNKLSLTTSSACLILAIHFLFVKEIVTNEAGHTSIVIEYKLGYYLWSFSFILLLLHNWVVITHGDG